MLTDDVKVLHIKNIDFMNNVLLNLNIHSYVTSMIWIVQNLRDVFCSAVHHHSWLFSWNLKNTLAGKSLAHFQDL